MSSTDLRPFHINGRPHPDRANTEILCTLGPASLDDRTIKRLKQCGATLLRINLSHTALAEVSRLVGMIRNATDLPICLDTEGAQIRTGEFVDGSITMRANTIVRAHFRRVPADDRNLYLYPRAIVKQLREGDFVSIDFNSVLVQVVARKSDYLAMRVLQGGVVGQNKAVTVERGISMPPLTDKDMAALQLGVDLGLRHFALSFAGAGADVERVREIVGEDAFVISKIESRRGLDNLEAIAARSDALLIDRGDLSREIPLELLPQTQKNILKRAKVIGCRVYVATNLLESMVSMPTPTRAEVNDIYNTLADGAHGLVLAAETAIGRYPIQCISMVNKIIRAFQQPATAGVDGNCHYSPHDAVSLLVEPHGGKLIHGEADRTALQQAAADLPQLAVSDKVLMDCEQFACGTYSPLHGFMDRETVDSVLQLNRLPQGWIWTLPLVLQVDAADVRHFGEGDRIGLTDRRGVLHALVDVSEVYRYELVPFVRQMYGTTSRTHPGVSAILQGGDHFVAGNVTLVKPLDSPCRYYSLTPSQTRFIFTQLGWSQVVGFHSRNPAHRGHERIQLEALERTGADGLYINPVLGPKKRGDFLPEPIMLSYQTLLEFGYYPPDRVVLGSFFTYSRYAGPREAVFTALCRKNMGCSHFIVGRDHTGAGQMHPPQATRTFFDSLGDLGIEPVFFDTIGYNSASGRYEFDQGQTLERLSGTEVREALRAGRQLPDWFMRDVVQEVLLAEMSGGRPLFHE